MKHPISDEMAIACATQIEQVTKTYDLLQDALEAYANAVRVLAEEITRKECSAVGIPSKER